MSRAVKDTRNIFLAQCISYALMFVASILLARILGPEDRGIYAKLIVSADLIILLTSFNLQTSITYFTAKKQISLNALLGIFSIILLSSFTIGCGLMIFTEKLGYGNIFFPNGNFSIHSTIFILFIVLSSLTIVFMKSILRGNKLFGDWSKILILEGLLKAIAFGGFLYWLVQFGGLLKIEMFLNLHIITLVMIIIVALFIFSKRIKFSGAINLDRQIFNKYFKYASIAFAVVFFTFLTQKLNIWLIEHYLDYASLGIYAVSLTYANLVIVPSMAIKTVLLPYLTSSNEESESINYFTQFSQLNITVTLLIVVLAILIAPYTIPILFGHSFSDSIIPAQILTPAIGFLAMNTTFSIYNFAKDHASVNTVAQILAFTVMLCVGIYVIPEFKLIGATFVSLIAYFVLFVYLVAYTIQKHNLPLKNYFFLTKSAMKKLNHLKYKKFNS